LLVPATAKWNEYYAFFFFLTIWCVFRVRPPADACPLEIQTGSRS
jgi:hypothetical protein